MIKKTIFPKFSDKENRCFIVAEVSANHGQKFNRALRLIAEAKRCGADAVKFQCYSPDTLTLNSNNKYFRVKHAKWGGQALYRLYKTAYTPWDWFKKLKKFADELGIVFFSTAFDTTSVDFLEGLNVPAHKIASFELVDLPLIKYMAKTKKPLILSTGMADRLEIRDALNAARTAGAKDIVLLKCVSSYPAKPEGMNLKTIVDMEKTFHCPVGLSDHSLSVSVPIAAVSLGAVMVEKHLTLSRRDKTPDSFFSIEPRELKELVENIRTVESALGRVYYGLTTQEKESRIFRRSLFAVQDIKKGERFSKDNVRSIRPSYGLSPKFFERILRKQAKKDIAIGTPLSWKLISG